jgi:hypothetical protein
MIGDHDEANPPVSASPAHTSDPQNEDALLAMLRHGDLKAEQLEEIARRGQTLKSRKIQVALAEHPRIPRHIALPLLRNLFTFDLMRVTLSPQAIPEIKRNAEDSLIRRLETITLGEKLSLARRGSGRLAGALLLDAEPRIVSCALDNSRLTEALVLQAMSHRSAKPHLLEAIRSHRKWSLRREVQLAFAQLVDKTKEME